MSVIVHEHPGFAIQRLDHDEEEGEHFSLEVGGPMLEIVRRSADPFVIAKDTFGAHLRNRPGAAQAVKRLVLGLDEDRGDWVARLTLLPASPEGDAAGLAHDMTGPRPTLLLTARINGRTGQATLREEAPLPWPEAHG